MHEFAYTGRPITATFAGAPSAAFTVYAATPQRDSATVGFLANTAVTDATQIYLRYDGTVGGGTDNHLPSISASASPGETTANSPDLGLRPDYHGPRAVGFVMSAVCPLYPGVFNGSAQHLLILLDQGVAHGDITDMVHGSSEG